MSLRHICLAINITNRNSLLSMKEEACGAVLTDDHLAYTKFNATFRILQAANMNLASSKKTTRDLQRSFVFGRRSSVVFVFLCRVFDIGCAVWLLDPGCVEDDGADEADAGSRAGRL
jgi:hypothetical protein